MNYRHVYMLIIEHAKKEVSLGLRPTTKYLRKDFPNQYFEFHHILPKSLFPLWKDRKSNIVPLTAREHFFCHQLLTKIYHCNQMLYALWRFVTAKNNKYCKVSSREYERIRLEFIIKPISDELKKKISIRTREAYAKYRNSPGDMERRRKISKYLTTRKMSDKGKKSISDKNRKSWSNLTEEEYKERCKKMSINSMGKGKGRVWSPETLKKISESNKGKVTSEEVKEKQRLAKLRTGSDGLNVGQRNMKYKRALYSMFKDKISWNDFQKVLAKVGKPLKDITKDDVVPLL